MLTISLKIKDSLLIIGLTYWEMCGFQYVRTINQLGDFDIYMEKKHESLFMAAD